MTEYKSVEQFNQQLDQRLGLAPSSASLSTLSSPQVELALEMGDVLDGMDFAGEIRPKAGLRRRWMKQTRKLFSRQTPRSWLAVYGAWVAALAVVIAFLFVFRQPVFAAVGRVFGYAYIPSAGFLPLDSTLVLAQPVLQEHDGRRLTATQGIATLRETTLWIEFNDIASPLDGAWLETETGENIALTFWEYSPNTPGSHVVKAVFPNLPSSTTQTTLALPEGWRLPLVWIPAGQWIVVDTSVIPYPSSSETRSQSSDVCAEQHGVRLCVLAVTANEDSTHILVEANSTSDALSLGGGMGELARQGIEGEPITLRDAQGNTMEPLPGFSPQLTLQANQQELVFPPLVLSSRQVTLTIPALMAFTELNQSITVDLGSNPMPGDTIAVNADIQVLGSTVRFRHATLAGDGVSGLRLILNADPVETVNELTPLSLMMGKPNRVDDLYGTGWLVGSKDLFVELVRPSGKINGTLTLPIVGATVNVAGPFEFRFTISESVPEVPAPTAAAPNSFSPAATPTPLLLDSYQYNGHLLNEDDLLYTVINGDRTDLYAFSTVSKQSALIATLPGAVSQIYLHPDHQGTDYLTGAQFSGSGFFISQYIRLYTLRFGDPAPRLLYSFPAIPSHHLIQVIPTWSFDGRYMVFQSAWLNPQPGGPVFQYSWFNMACRTDGNCSPKEFQIPTNLELYQAIFSPKDYRLLFSGTADQSSSDGTGIFLMDFDPNNPASPVIRLTNPPNVAGRAVWFLDGRILSICADKDLVSFCLTDPQTGKTDYSRPVSEHLYRYQASPSGNQIVSTVINHQLRKGILEVRLFDLNGQPGPVLASETILMLGDVLMSPSDQHLVFITGDANQIKLIDLATNTIFTVYDSSTEGTVSWAGWVR